MVREMNDFVGMWEWEATQTTNLLSKISNENLNKAVPGFDKTLGELGWHLVEAVVGMANQLGLTTQNTVSKEESLKEVNKLVEAYGNTMKSFADSVKEHWNNEALLEMVHVWGFDMEKGHVLTSLQLHQAHHRGQMTVLMRVLANPIVGIYGPTKEEVEAMKKK